VTEEAMTSSEYNASRRHLPPVLTERHEPGKGDRFFNTIPVPSTDPQRRQFGRNAVPVSVETNGVTITGVSI
jgi:hypothetical protein